MNNKSIETHIDSENKYHLRNISLEITNECNFRCKYCYLEQSRSQSNIKESSYMSYEVGQLAVDYLYNHSLPNSHCSICFIGGEPLLCWSIIVKIVEYAKKRFENSSKRVSFGITTNGYLLDYEVIKFLFENQIFMTLSFDGTRDAQDSMRVTYSNSSSYDRIVQNIGLLHKYYGANFMQKISVRATITRMDLDIFKIAKSIEKLGFSKICLTPVTISDINQDFAIREEDLPFLLSGYKALANRFFENLINNRNEPVSWFRRYFEQILRSNLRKSTCGAGLGYVGISTDGYFYICHRFFGIKTAQLGSLDDGFNFTFTNQIIKTPVETKPICKNCWAQSYCGGPCYFEGYNKHKSYFLPNHINCEIIKYSIGLVFKMISMLHMKYPSILKKVEKKLGLIISMK